MIPDYQAIMLPLLRLAEDGEEHKFRDAIEILANHFELTHEEREKLLPSQTQPIFDNRTGWSKTHLIKAGLLEATRRSYFKITARGRGVLNQHPEQINQTHLRQFSEYLEFIRPNVSEGEEESIVVINSTATPDEIMDSAYQEIRRTLVQDLLTKIKECTPGFFEQLVVKLLVRMGYGGSLKDAGEATRLTNDEGIDGIIKEDKLGLDVIYIQAKRWDTQSVGRPDIQSFVGALDGQRANKGVFITTSRFAENAKNYVKTITKKVILIDGEQLASYMIDYGLGVNTASIYEIKKIDSDFFGE